MRFADCRSAIRRAGFGRAGSMLITTIAALLTVMAAQAEAAEGSSKPTPRVITRVFIQDPGEVTLRWADVLAGEPTKLTEPQIVAGFPQLDPERQTLVQMQAAAGKIMVGVRDNEDGEFQSGWVLIDSGVEEEEHGDHSHWYYTAEPRVLASRLDESQGNPAHLYCYDGVFYLANDRIGGFTRLDPSAIPPGSEESLIRSLAAFHVGGNGHITLAVAGDVAFSTWMSREPEHAARIDVTPVSASGTQEIAYSFSANSTGLHGATAAAGKVFFAPAEGIDWIEVPKAPLAGSPEPVVHNLSLGESEGKPLRTGSFANLGNHVLFVSGRGDASFLGVINAAADKPAVTKVGLAIPEGARASGPKLIMSRTHGPLAIVFHDRAADVDAPDKASVIALDPDRDGDFADAKEIDLIDVGASAVEGHSGHHDLAVDSLGRFAVITSPGDRSFEVRLTSNLVTVAAGELPFAPGHIVAVGGRGPLINPSDR